MKRFIVSVVALVGLVVVANTVTLNAQRALSIEDLETWNRIQDVSINASGTHSVYVLRPDKGDPITVVVDNANGREERWPHTDDPAFSYDGRYLLATRRPTETQIRNLKKEKEKAEGLDSLIVLELNSGKVVIHPTVHRWKTGEKWSDFYVYTTKSLLADSLRGGLAKKSHRLVVRRFDTSDSLSLEGVSEFVLARDVAGGLVVRAAHDSLWTDGVHYFGADLTLSTLAETKGEYAQPALSPDAQRGAFLSYLDTIEREQPPFHLHGWRKGEDRTRVLSENAGEWLPRNFRISDDGNLSFSDSGDRLYFGIAPRRPEKDTALLDEEMADVEVWTSQDEWLYTHQNVLAPREKRRTYRAVYHWPQDIVGVLGGPDRETVLTEETGDADWVLRYDDRAYRPLLSWEGGTTAKDLYLYNSLSGEERIIASAVKGSPRWSPAGRFVYWYQYPDTAWMAYEPATRQLRQLTGKGMGTFHDAEDDHPDFPNPHGSAGWTEDDAAFLVYDRYDWWKIDPRKEMSGERLTMTGNEKIRLRYLDLDPDEKSVPTDRPLLVATFNENNYHGGYAWLDPSNGRVEDILGGPFTLGRRPTKARLADRLLFTRGDFETFPDLHFATYREPLKASHWQSKKISDANPQQSAFGWGSAEIYEWIDNQGRTLRGILVKPPNFDPDRKYPLMVNFYERSSEGVYQHRAPYPHRSTMNYSYYASRGYVIFNPDVIYRIGYPGESAYDCVMSGVTALLGEGFVDRDRIGVQGHSWGGYQVAHLVTKTDLFACAESGAPVVNMFSAYGGIRWGSGLSRQFQYERSQSRIGGTIWEYPLRYLENSPLFFTDKVNTPLLIMHNDKDGAVPWYQGIEYFTALRRLGKPAWMLNYRGEPHWPLKQANRVDFQRRMSQFFDHYLMDAPRPQWMKEGVSPLERGIEQGYEVSKE